MGEDKAKRGGRDPQAEAVQKRYLQRSGKELGQIDSVVVVVVAAAGMTKRTRKEMQAQPWLISRMKLKMWTRQRVAGTQMPARHPSQHLSSRAARYHPNSRKRVNREEISS